MQIKIQGHGMDLTPALKAYAEKKIGKLDEFFSNIIKAEIILDDRHIRDSKRRQVAEVSMWVAGKKVIRATEAGEDMYAAIDLVSEELKQQLKKFKDKHVKNKRREAEEIKRELRTFRPSL